MFVAKTPKTPDEFKQYFQFRWQWLRAPWQQPLGSEQDSLEDCSFHRMLVNVHQQIVAVGRLHQISPDVGQVRYVAVDPNYQRQGLGQSIMQQLEQQAQQLGISQIELNARENAVPFYEHMGYQNQGFSHKLFDSINHYRMTKRLAENQDHRLIQQANSLTELWHKTIPMSQFMQLAITAYDERHLVTQCQQQPNKNLHNTMFAGSIYTQATLTGWGAVYLALSQQGVSGDIVLAKADIRYSQPIKGQAYAQVSTHTITKQLTPLFSGQKVKIPLAVSVCCGDDVCAVFNGVYAVLPRK
jgi:thioesterase domain-containing protein